MQVKNNLKQEVENMENEIVQLKAQLETDSDFEETKLSVEENVSGDYTLCKKTASVAVGAKDKLSDLAQKEVLASCETEDWPELSATAVEMFCEPMLLPHDTATADRQSVGENTLTEHNSDDMSADAQFHSNDRPADRLIDSDILRAASSIRDHDRSVSAVPVVDVSGANMTVSVNCIQLPHAGTIDQETVSAVPDSLDENRGVVRDDSNSCVSCEDIVIPDSDDDLFCSLHNVNVGAMDRTALTSHADDLKYGSMIVTVSDISNDVHIQSDEVGVCAQPMNVLDANNSEKLNSVSSCARAMKGKQCASKEKYSNKNHTEASPHNNVPCPRNQLNMSDAEYTDLMQHTLSVHADSLAKESQLCGTDETAAPGLEVHQLVHEQLPKRPHWTFVVSGISQALDQVTLFYS